MFPLSLADDLELRPLALSDADTFLSLIASNRAHLDQWLRWSGRIQTSDDARALIERFTLKLAAGDGFHAGIWLDKLLVGGIVCHGINRESRKSEIGYWLSEANVGKGIVTRACRAVIAELFTGEDLHRLEIQCAVDNVRSRAVAERLGFTFEGVKRESEWITTRYVDHALYSLLRQEWEAAR